MAQSALRNLPLDRMNVRRERAGMEPLTQEEVTKRRLAGNSISQFTSLDTPQDMSLGATAADIGMGFLPVVGTAQGIRDFERARRDDNMLGMALGGLSAIPIAGGVVKAGRGIGRAVEGALDMSQAARMQRAQDMGFDTERVFYHGTTSDFDKFDLEKAGKNDSGWYGRGIYLTPDPDTASAYTQYQDHAQRTGVDGANVLPVRARIKNPYYWPENRKAALDKAQSEAITQELLAQGFDGVIVPNKYADPKFADMYEVVAFSPEQVRSVNAEFNPANRGSANLMAGVMGGAVGLSALRQLMPQKEQE